MDINFAVKLIFEEEYLVPKSKKRKVRKLNPRTNRMKNFKRIDYYKTNIPPEKRTLKNKPDMVRFQDWLLIKGERCPESVVNSFGKSAADGKWYGWSHRAAHGFKIGEKIKPDTIGNNTKKSWIIKDEKQARDAAMKFAKDVS